MSIGSGRPPPEMRGRILEALRVGVEMGYGYARIWRMLREDGFEVSRRAVRYWFYKTLLERVRGRGRHHRPLKLRIKLYKKVLELRKQGLRYKKIRSRVEEIYGIRLSLAMISYWCRRIHSPLGGMRIPTVDSLKPSPELAYVIDVVAGDGSACRTRKIENNEYRIKAMVKDREFAEEFAKCLGSVLNRDPPKPTPAKKGLLEVRVVSRALYELLRKPIDIKRIRRFVECSEDCVRNFLRGFFDSEGSVGRGDGDIICYNSDKRPPQTCSEALTWSRDRGDGPTSTSKEGNPHPRQEEWKGIHNEEECLHSPHQGVGQAKVLPAPGIHDQEETAAARGIPQKTGLLPPNQPSPTLLSSSIHFTLAMRALAECSGGRI